MENIECVTCKEIKNVSCYYKINFNELEKMMLALEDIIEIVRPHVKKTELLEDDGKY